MSPIGRRIVATGSSKPIGFLLAGAAVAVELKDYYKPKNSPQLLAKRIASKDDPLVAMRLSEFLAAAWRLANNKARELGWIV